MDAAARLWQTITLLPALAPEVLWYYNLVADEGARLDASEDNLAARLAALNAWFAEAGGRGAVEVRYDKHSRGGVFATAELRAGDEYVIVPRKLLLDRAAALAGPDGAAYLRTEARVDALLASPGLSWAASCVTLCARLAVERRNGNASAFAPYVASLPRDFSRHPLLWGGRGDAALQGTYLLECLARQRAGLRSFVAAARACLDAALPPLSRGELAWAYLCWLTRCIGIVHENGATAWAFVPVVDMTNCRWSAAAACTRTIYDAERDAAVMRTPQDLKRGDEVFENYGWSNFDYAIAHGFALDECPRDELVARPRSLSFSVLLSAALGAP
eukprot:CAMPEP_0119293778 /NCGR_PEP_ID=MMETSP1329-20130426/46693_1 /TAXON_ID=114041 /ORGANISM="Genus nov. species nov., Strain RCC1024" /LENGTH=330 /DNA_ID=CAMNT_0007294651 /DNA_START=16 /DNA_END=1005 /DNA_ORIENTATION=-